MSASLAVPILLLLAAVGPKPSPSPPPTPTPTPTPRLQIDVDRQVQGVLESDPRLRFETSVEVVGQTPQRALEAHLFGFNTMCGPAGGPPTAVESREFRPRMPPSVDLLALAQAAARLAGRMGMKTPERFFLYRAVKADGVSYVVREGRMPTSALYGPGVVYEPVAGFPDAKTATQAWRRMERGYASPVARSTTTLPPWALTTCPPGKE